VLLDASCAAAVFAVVSCVVDSRLVASCFVASSVVASCAVASCAVFSRAECAATCAASAPPSFETPRRSRKEGLSRCFILSCRRSNLSNLGRPGRKGGRALLTVHCPFFRIHQHRHNPHFVTNSLEPLPSSFIHKMLKLIQS
jgi:hypothetical protein